MSPDQTVLQAAIRAHQSGDLRGAEELYGELLKADPHSAQLLKWLGSLKLQQDEFETAIELLQQSLAAEPSQADALVNLGGALRASGRYREAVAAYEAAVRLQPERQEAKEGLGGALTAWGFVLLNAKKYVAAGEKLDAAAAVADVGENWGRARVQAAENSGDWMRAEGLLEAMGQRSHRDDIRLRDALLLPQLYWDDSDLLRWRRRYQEKVGGLAKETLSLSDPQASLLSTPFRLAYQGHNDRALQESVSGLFQGFLPAGAIEKGMVRATRRRPRVVFVSAFCYRHSVMTCFGRLVTGMAGKTFEVVLASMPNGRWDAETQRLQSGVDRFVQLPRQLAAARQVLVDLLPDIVVFTDLGMALDTYCLAHTRYAPIQAVLPGHPVTTGIATVDYFLSSALSEGEEAETHYSETLIRLKNPYIDYPRPALPKRAKNRSGLGLPETGNLYVCPVTLFKLLPAFDDALAEILRGDPQGWVILSRLFDTQLHEQFLARFREHHGDVAHRVVFLPWLPADEWKGVLAQAAVVLDPFHFSGGNTCRIALAMGIPVVTWPSRFLRGRIASGLYRRMGYEGCVADSPSNYAALACRLALDAAAREAAVAAIQEMGGVLLENDEGTRELAALFESWLA